MAKKNLNKLAKHGILYFLKVLFMRL